MFEQKGTMSEIQLVVFDLSSEYYGIDIGAVREIIRLQSVTKVPGAASFIKGVINLRGRVVPVIDLRKRLNLKVSGPTKESRIVVVDSTEGDIGVMVDAVTEVLRVPVSSIESTSLGVTNIEADYLRGIAKLPDKLVILLDLNKVLVQENTRALSGSSAAAEETMTVTEPAKTGGKHADHEKKVSLVLA